MKRGWIALALIGICLVLGGIEYLYVTTGADVYVQMLDDADEKIERNEIYDAASVAERLDHRFSAQSTVFDVFMYHSDVGAISNDLAMLRRYAQTGATEEFLATSARVKREILAIRNAKQLKWENIF